MNRNANKPWPHNPCLIAKIEFDGISAGYDVIEPNGQEHACANFRDAELLARKFSAELRAKELS